MRRTRLVFAYLMSIVLAGLPLAALAQPSPAEPSALVDPATVPPAASITPVPAPPAPTYPYTGYISTDLVNLRCGPALYYYALLTVSKNTPVTVEAEKNNWLALRPPEGIHGLVRKSDVTIDAAGAGATVSAPSARVYASSATANRRWCVMATLTQGDTVQVRGPGDGGFIKVAPPESARVWVVDQYVAATGSTDPLAPTQRTTVPTDIQPPKDEPLVETFKEAEKDLRAQLAKDVPERNFDDVAAKFTEVAEKAEKAYLKNAAKRRLATIAALAEQKAEYVRVASLADKLDERLADIKTDWAGKQAETQHDQRLLKSDFLATGFLAKMESLEDVDYPIKFKLVDQNNRPLVVLKSTAYDLTKYVGKIVGVRGTKTYLREWGIYLVTVDDMEVVEE